MVEQSCGTCVFFRRMTSDAGECRRMPPQVVVLQQSGMQPTMDPRTNVITEQRVIVQKPQGVFPALKVDDPGCGEYHLAMVPQPPESPPDKAAEPAASKAMTMHDR